MLEEEKDTQTTPSEEAQTEPKIEESVTEPEVVETVQEIVPETLDEVPVEPVATTPETETAQMGGNEPLPEIPQVENEGAEATAEASEKPTPTPNKEEREPREEEDKPTKQEPDIKEKLGLLRQMARATIQLRREKKLAKIMALFAKQTTVTNDEVEKLLHVSDATATRYLSILAERGKLKQVGRTGRGVRYERR